MSDKGQWIVLLVDDSEDDRGLFTYSFHRAGISGRIIEAEDGDAAIQTLEEARRSAVQWPHAMFLDLKMPVRDGFEVLSWFKETVPDRPLDIYVLSGSNVPSDMQRARDLGAHGYLTKPITGPKLQELFQAWSNRG
jgi:CheY-like chemotaxis protein